MKDSAKTIKSSFRDKEYRHGYVDDFLNTSIATQIKVLREQRGWSQQELAKHAEMLQPRISVMENINYSSWSIKILRKIAEAFDLTLRVSFESFGTRVKDIEEFSRKALERASFLDDPYFKEEDAARETLLKLATGVFSKPIDSKPAESRQDIQIRDQYTPENLTQRTFETEANKARNIPVKPHLPGMYSNIPITEKAGVLTAADLINLFVSQTTMDWNAQEMREAR